VPLPQAHLYQTAPGKETSHTEQLEVGRYATIDLRRALSDVDQVLRFWNPDCVSGSQEVRLVNPVPVTGISDAYSTQETEMVAEYKCIYAKAWLLRGTIRSDINNLADCAKFQPDADFRQSEKLDPYDGQLYVAWGRGYWRGGVRAHDTCSPALFLAVQPALWW
jgi:hypothetical protein